MLGIDAPVQFMKEVVRGELQQQGVTLIELLLAAALIGNYGDRLSVHATGAEQTNSGK